MRQSLTNNNHGAATCRPFTLTQSIHNMKQFKTLYRVDDYYNNSGTLLYMTADEPSYNNPITAEQANRSGNFLQVTKFDCPQHLDGFEAWEHSQNLADFYYMPQ